jgi:hypothetical protein
VGAGSYLIYTLDLSGELEGVWSVGMNGMEWSDRMNGEHTSIGLII